MNGSMGSRVCPSPNLMRPTLLSRMASPVTGRTSQGLFLTCSSHLRQLFTSISSQHSLAEKLDLLALPTRLGGMRLANPTSNSSHAFQASLRITAPLVASQDLHQTVEKADQLKIKKQVKKTNRELQQQRARDTTAQLTPQLQRSVELAQEKGSSAWLTVLPMVEHGFL